MDTYRARGVVFQSTLPSEKESDWHGRCLSDLLRRFQSTLPSEKESDRRMPRTYKPGLSFNPRSPPKRRATGRGYDFRYEQLFQSTLPSEKESDVRDH